MPSFKIVPAASQSFLGVYSLFLTSLQSTAKYLDAYVGIFRHFVINNVSVQITLQSEQNWRVMSGRRNNVHFT